VAEPGANWGREAAGQIETLLMRVHQLTRQRLRLLVQRENDLSHTDLLVLWTVSNDSPLRMIDLSRQLGIPASTLTSLVDRLERAGYVRRQPDPSDRRVLHLEGTAALGEFGRRISALVQAELVEPVARLDADDLAALLRGMELLIRVLEDRPEAGGPGPVPGDRDRPGASGGGAGSEMHRATI
jgi:DNA-binding MarR family transcriptional regulator